MTSEFKTFPANHESLLDHLVHPSFLASRDAALFNPRSFLLQQGSIGHYLVCEHLDSNALDMEQTWDSPAIYFPCQRRLHAKAITYDNHRATSHHDDSDEHDCNADFPWRISSNADSTEQIIYQKGSRVGGACPVSGTVPSIDYHGVLCASAVGFVILTRRSRNMPCVARSRFRHLFLQVWARFSVNGFLASCWVQPHIVSSCCSMQTTVTLPDIVAASTCRNIPTATINSSTVIN